jgi:hypothetical protein
VTVSTDGCIIPHPTPSSKESSCETRQSSCTLTRQLDRPDPARAGGAV